MSSADSEWEVFVRAHPQGHILQTSNWGLFKSAFGWKPEIVRLRDQGALILFRRLPHGLTLAYEPRGPLADWNQAEGLEALVETLDSVCRKQSAICLKWEPELPEAPGFSGLLT